MSEYISELSTAIKAAHGCESVHLHALPAREAFGPEAGWDGTVELFLIGIHARASMAYAWGVRRDGGWQVTTALKVPRAGLSPVRLLRVATPVAAAPASAAC